MVNSLSQFGLNRQIIGSVAGASQLGDKNGTPKSYRFSENTKSIQSTLIPKNKPLQPMKRQEMNNLLQEEQKLHVPGPVHETMQRTMHSEKPTTDAEKLKLRYQM